MGKKERRRRKEKEYCPDGWVVCEEENAEDEWVVVVVPVEDPQASKFTGCVV